MNCYSIFYIYELVDVSDKFKKMSALIISSFQKTKMIN